MMKSPKGVRTIGKLFFPLLASSFLLGCGNAYERLETRAWQPIGKAVLPKSDETKVIERKVRASTLDGGTGREAKLGSAVQIRISATSGSMVDPATDKVLQSAEAWVWIGDGDTPDGRPVGLGAAVLRSLLIGVRERGRLAVSADAPHIGTFVLPLRGILLSFAYKKNWRQLIPSGTHASLDQEYVGLPGKGEYELQLLRVCDGRLSRKEATLKQWGFVFNWGDAHYRFAREGLLEWIALEIDCGAGSQIRFEKGPAYGIYTPGYSDNPLLGWQESYERMTKR